MRGRPPKEIVRNVAVKIRLTPEENTLLTNVCERTGQTKSEVIRNALNEYSRLVATKAIDINAQVNLTRTDMDNLAISPRHWRNAVASVRLISYAGFRAK